MKVKDVMTKNVIIVDKDVDLNNVLTLMKKHDITKIPVVENKKLIGVITDNMIAYKLGSKRKRGITASRLHASSVTDKDVETVSPDADIKTILSKVGEPGPTLLNVMENDKLVGIVTKADLLPLVKSNKKLREIMQKKMHTIAPDDRVVHARRVMIDEGVARLPVISQGRLLGIISDTEIAFALANIKRSFSLGRQKHQLEELLVEDVMKTPVVWTGPNTTATDAAKIMIKHNVGALPVVENDSIIGIITRTDLIKTVSI